MPRELPNLARGVDGVASKVRKESSPTDPDSELSLMQVSVVGGRASPERLDASRLLKVQVFALQESVVWG